MAFDHALAEAAARGNAPAVLRFFGWNPPAVSVGYNQSLRGREAAVAELRRHGLDAVRRPSGGGAVLHVHEVTYSVAARLDTPLLDHGPRAACARIHAAILHGLMLLGVEGLSVHQFAVARRESGRPATADGRPAEAMPTVDPSGLSYGAPAGSSITTPSCFALPSRSEIVWRGRKIVGSAQRRLGRAILQHGSILMAGDQAVLRLLWPDSVGEGRSVTLAEAGGRRFGFGEVAAAVRRGFERVLGAVFEAATLDPAEARRVESLVHARYGRDDYLFRI